VPIVNAPKKTPPLRALALVFVTLGCGASVARIDSDVPGTADASVLVDAPVAVLDAPVAVLDAPVAVLDVSLRPDVRVAVDVLPRTDVPVAVDVPVVTVDVPGRPDVGLPPGDAGPGPSCALVGTEWDLEVGGKTAVFAFTMSRRWVISADGSEVVSGDYAVEGERVILSGEMSGGGACSPTDRGVFTLQFSADCRQLRLALVNDDCADRGDSIDRFGFTRR
jgi:hypothetical protein